MGNFFKGTQEEDYILELLKLCGNTLSTETIYDTMMKTNCNTQLDLASELIGLYNRFTLLDIDKRGKLTNQEFLSMSELFNNPFRNRLKIALPLKSEEYIKNVYKNSEIKDESFEKATIIPQGNVTGKIAPEPEEVSEADKLPYIDFSQFCIYLAVFCPRSPSDLKFDCNIYTVAFRLFDIDGDGLLSEQDLFATIKILVAQNLNPDTIKKAIEHILSESDKEGKGYLTKEEFQKSLWMTDFTQKLSLYFV